MDLVLLADNRAAFIHAFFLVGGTQLALVNLMEVVERDLGTNAIIYSDGGQMCFKTSRCPVFGAKFPKASGCCHPGSHRLSLHSKYSCQQIQKRTVRALWISLWEIISHFGLVLTSHLWLMPWKIALVG